MEKMGAEPDRDVAGLHSNTGFYTVSGGIQCHMGEISKAAAFFYTEYDPSSCWRSAAGNYDESVSKFASL